MKPIIMNMREMSLSKEVYDKKPGKFFTIFIYGLFALVITALVWSYFGRLDVVVRAQGIIRPHAQTAVVLSAVHGELTGVFFYEGMEVRRGDILYTVDTFQLENHRLILTNSLSQLQFELESHELFRKSIDSGVNQINSFNYEASTRFDNFLINFDATNHVTAYRYELLREEERTLSSALEYTHFELEMLRLFENAIHRGQDLFGAASMYGINREVRNNHRNQFLHFTAEQDNLAFQANTIYMTLRGLNNIRTSLTSDYDAFDAYDFNIYRSRYMDFLLQLEQLTELYQTAQENDYVYASLFHIGAVSYAERQAAQTNMSLASARITELKNTFLRTIEHEIRTANNTHTHILNQKEMLQVGTLANISAQALRLESSILEMNMQISQSRLQQDSMFRANDSAGEAEMLRLNELNRTFAGISALEQEIAQTKINLHNIDAQINDSVVRAPIDGYVTIQTELTEGGFIMSGVHVLSIVPSTEDVFNANILINNNDIGQINEGMPVRFDIAAMPQREFGEITGTITRIATDISHHHGAAGYFLVESELANIIYYDSRGNGASLRVGMAFEARIVVEQQRILFFLLDRLNLLFH